LHKLSGEGFFVHASSVHRVGWLAKAHQAIETRQGALTSKDAYRSCASMRRKRVRPRGARSRTLPARSVGFDGIVDMPRSPAPRRRAAGGMSLATDFDALCWSFQPRGEFARPRREQLRGLGKS
jgi:hypothetical protein